MDRLILNKFDNLMENGCFKSKLELYEYMIMKIINDNDGPIGAWELKSTLNNYGAKLSTASIGRYLKEMDSKGTAELASNKGRILTDKGRIVLSEKEEIVTSTLLHNNIREATKIADYSQLIQLYYVRQALEIEVVREAILYASDEEINAIEHTNEEYKKCIERKEDFTDPALSFHAVLAKSTKNRFLESILIMLIYEQKRIEAKFEILATRKMECGREYTNEHEKIYDALKQRNLEKATQLMIVHLEGLRCALENEIGG